MGNIDAQNANHGTLSTSACPKQTLHMSGPSLGVEWCSCPRSFVNFPSQLSIFFWMKSVVVLSTIGGFDMSLSTHLVDGSAKSVGSSAHRILQGHKTMASMIFGGALRPPRLSSNDLDVLDHRHEVLNIFISSKYMQADSAVYGDFLNSKHSNGRTACFHPTCSCSRDGHMMSKAHWKSSNHV